MNVDDDELSRMIVEAVANDFEDFETIVGELVRWTDEGLGKGDVDRIERALLKSVADGFVAAFEPSGSPQTRLVQAEADRQRIRAQWFYITAKGISHLESLEAEDAEGAKNPTSE